MTVSDRDTSSWLVHKQGNHLIFVYVVPLQFKGEGNDDLRQDAVMEQVFELVNNILRRDRETRRRDLTIRDYRVIPLSSQAGVLEFVGNTIPLSNWLKPAHARYDIRQPTNSDWFIL